MATWRISQLNQRAHRLLAGRLAAEGFTGYQYRLLAALVDAGEASQVELGRRAGLDRSDVAGGLDLLAARGLVVRSPDPADRRRNIVTLTTEGATTLEKLDEVVEKVQDDLVAALSERDRRHFDRIIDLLLESTSADPDAG
ncbi:MAG: MarR family transcriptional regulator [Aldersonia sp.]|nr:MarR family transcriptional regulator [Aldersonia sp.]